MSSDSLAFLAPRAARGARQPNCETHLVEQIEESPEKDLDVHIRRSHSKSREARWEAAWMRDRGRRRGAQHRVSCSADDGALVALVEDMSLRSWPSPGDLMSEVVVIVT